MTEPVRILYIDHTSALGGAERSLLDLLARLDRTRVAPLVVTSPQGPLVDRVRALGIEVVLLELDEASLTLSREAWDKGPLAFAWRARGYFAEVIRLTRLVRNRRIHALHTNTLKAHVMGSLVAKLARRPIVWHMRDLPSTRGNTHHLLAKLGRHLAPGVIAISQAVADDMPGQLGARTRVVYNGVDLADFDRRAVEASDGIPAGEGPVVGTVSHLIPWKGQDVFLKAAAQVLKTHATCRFVIVGDDIFQFRGERERLRVLAETLGIADRVVFAGNREDVPALLRRMDLFVLPSLYEPFGRVLIEAMAAGLPIVASRAGGVPEIVLDGETGLLVPPGDDGAMAAAIAGLLADPVRAMALGAAGRVRVEARFSLDATVAGVAAAYAAFGVMETFTSPAAAPPALR